MFQSANPESVNESNKKQFREANAQWHSFIDLTQKRKRNERERERDRERE